MDFCQLSICNLIIKHLRIFSCGIITSHYNDIHLTFYNIKQIIHCIVISICGSVGKISERLNINMYALTASS